MADPTAGCSGKGQMRHQMFLHYCSGLSNSKEGKRWNSRNHSSQVSLPHEFKNRFLKRRHQDTSNYSKLQEKAGKVQTRATTFRARLLCGCGLACAHAHKNNRPVPACGCIASPPSPLNGRFCVACVCVCR